MFMCEECNYLWEEQPRYIGDPETTHCPNCGSAEIEETKLQNLPNADAYSLLAEVRAAIGRIESYCGDVDCKRGVRNILAECQKISEHFS